MAPTERGAVQSSPTVKYFMQPCLGTTNVIPVLIRGCLYFVLAKYAWENAHPNSGDEPPQVTHAMRAVKMKFIEATIRLLVVDEAKHEDVFAVERWVLMSQNTVTVNTSSTKRKYGEDGLPNETPTTPSTPSMKNPPKILPRLRRHPISFHLRQNVILYLRSSRSSHPSILVYCSVERV